MSKHKKQTTKQALKDKDTTNTKKTTIRRTRTDVSPHTRSNKLKPGEIAEINVLKKTGLSLNEIRRQTGKGINTIKKYLSPDVLTKDIDVVIEAIEENMSRTNTLLQAKSSVILDKYQDAILEGNIPIEKAQLIPTLAIKDKAFEHNRLISNKSTQNISVMQTAINGLNSKKKDLEDRLEALKS